MLKLEVTLVVLVDDSELNVRSYVSDLVLTPFAPSMHRCAIDAVIGTS